MKADIELSENTLNSRKKRHDFYSNIMKRFSGLINNSNAVVLNNIPFEDRSLETREISSKKISEATEIQKQSSSLRSMKNISNTTAIVVNRVYVLGRQKNKANNIYSVYLLVSLALIFLLSLIVVMGAIKLIILSLRRSAYDKIELDRLANRI